mgnify:CR=1 FL=1|tara:strand:- start:348 stop:1094 length:747 start_codon:yes stop_codon:yes gene_type:complete
MTREEERKILEEYYSKGLLYPDLPPDYSTVVHPAQLQHNFDIGAVRGTVGEDPSWSWGNVGRAVARDITKGAKGLLSNIPEAESILDFFISPTQPQEYTTYSADVLDKIGERLGRNAYNLHQFSFDVGGFESDHGTNIQNPLSSARGTYQFTKDTIPTAINRLTKVLGYKPTEIKEFQQSENADIAKLSPDVQRALFLAHLSEDSGSDILINRYLDGEDVGEELFIEHHYKGLPDAATRRRLKEKKWF